MSKKKKLSLSIDPLLLIEFEAYCRKERRSISNAAELAIEEFLRNHSEGGKDNAES